MLRSVGGSIEEYDVVIIGGGLIGSIVAAELLRRKTTLSLAIVDRGRVFSERAGQHLLTSARGFRHHAYGPRSSWIDMKRASSIRTGPTVALDGVIPASSLGHHLVQFPGLAVANTLGGLGVHWSARCPTPRRGEIPACVHQSDWDLWEASAIQTLDVAPLGSPGKASEGLKDVTTWLSTIASEVRRRESEVVPMPLAGRWLGETFFVTAPENILPEYASFGVEQYDVWPETLCLGIDELRSGRQRVRVSSASGNSVGCLYARRVVITGGALLASQLLAASSIHAPWNGRYLNEHVVIVAECELPTRLDLSEADMRKVEQGGFLMAGDHQTPQGQIQLLPTPHAQGQRLSLSWSVPTEQDAANRLLFSSSEVDVLGLPKATVDYQLSPADQRAVKAAREEQLHFIDFLGAQLVPETTRILAPGGSLHATGTTRIGLSVEGGSVCDATGRVWGTRGIFVAGNSAIPTSLACNSTLTAASLAVGTAHAVFESA